MSSAVGTAINIRDIELLSDVRQVEAFQKEVWGVGDLDVVPLTQLVAARHCGGVLVGAFDGETMVGFAYGFVSSEGGHTGIHSHMLAVKPEYRNFDLGYRLKLAQRERALSAGFTRMTWTFDPLQSLNAHFNFGKLGVVADQYKINFYGEETSSFLHRMGTDRLWVSWLLANRRVLDRLERGSKAQEPPRELGQITPLVQLQADGSPRRNDLGAGLSGVEALIDIPADINGLHRKDGELAFEWREATRWAFTQALASGYLVEDFFRETRGEQPSGVYLLSRGKRLKASPAEFAKEFGERSVRD